MRVEGRWIDYDSTSGDDTTARWDFTISLAGVAATLDSGQVWEKRFLGTGDDGARAEIVIRFAPDPKNKPYP